MKKVMTLIVSYLDVLLFTLFLSIKLMTFDMEIGNTYYHSVHTLSTFLASILVLVGLCLLLKRKKRNSVLLCLNLILSIFLIADINYYRYFKDILSIPVLRNGIMLNSVKSSVQSVFKLKDFLYLADIIFIYGIMNYVKQFSSFKEVRFPIRFASFVLLLSIGVSYSGFKIYTLSVEQPRLISTMYNKLYIAKEVGCIDFHFLDAYNFFSTKITNQKPIPAQQAATIQNFLEADSSNTSSILKGEAKGKNLIVIQVEALQGFVINQQINGKEITPNLNKWLKSTAYFNNYFYQISSGGTSDAEFLSNNSLYPAPSGAAYYLYSNNTYNSLADALKNQGYGTSVMHGYTATFWNRNAMYKAEKFDQFYCDKNYTIDEKVGLGLSDKSYLAQSLEKIKALPSPYYNFMITLSSHFPYDDTKNYGSFDVGEFEGTMLGNYLKAIHYTDEQLGTFLDALDKEKNL